MTEHKMIVLCSFLKLLCKYLLIILFRFVGGPLQAFHHNLLCMYTVVGVTSFDSNCGTKLPGIYTRVYSYLNWIEQIVWLNATF